MAAAHALVPVGSTATPLLTLADKHGNLADGQNTTRSVSFQVPTGGQTVFIGGAGVTTTSYGYRLDPGQTAAFDLTADDALYGVVASGSQPLAALHLGL